MIEGGIAVLDFGSQLTQLIARRLREIGVYSELFPFNADIEQIKRIKPKGIILSGGPSSVYDQDAPLREVRPLAEIAPVLGICYGMQLIARELGGVVESADKREYGLNSVSWSDSLSPTVPKKQRVWMSHGDIVKVPPPGFQIIATSDNHAAALRSERYWALQFHPEVSHTEHGVDILEAFALRQRA